MIGKYLTNSNFIFKSNQKHNNRYDYSLVNYQKNRKRVVIICQIHGMFEQTPYKHLKGHGCLKCCGTNRITLEEFELRSNEIHNNKYNYSLVNYINSRVKIIITCPIHGQFMQLPKEHLSGCGCPKCFGKNKTTEEYIKEVKIIHKNKYDYSLVNYINNRTKIKIICSIHGEFEQIPNSHSLGFGCSECSKNKKLTTNSFIIKANLKHGKKYDYSLVNCLNNYTKVKIICKIHGEFEQTANSHLNGRGCSKCRESKGEIKIKEYLENNKINYIKEKKFDDCKGIRNKLPFDFYLPEYNTCIEYDGEQHFKPVKFSGCSDQSALKTFNKLKLNDNIKNEYCKINNIFLFRIPYICKDIDLCLNNIIKN